jgi:Na+-transporting NADH:ubiquinone oxidoreductase subunit B
VWVAGLEKAAAGAAASYGWIHLNVFNPLFESFGWALFNPAATVVDGYTGATPMALAFQGGWQAVTETYTDSQMLWGVIPGSLGETSKPLIIAGALFLVLTKIADWRIMLSMVGGAVVMSLLLNAWGVTDFMRVPWYYQFYIGSFWFAMAFMATDPVTASATATGKWIYGFLIGFIGMIIRVLNPAYPEGWMLAILFMNVFAPLIDFYVLEANIKRRLKRAKVAA